MIQQREGNDACEKFFNDNMVSYGKYLQVLFIYLTFKGDLERIKTLLDNFIKDQEELTKLFEGMKVIPEDKVTVKRRETIRVTKKPEGGDSNEVFGDAEVAKLVELAKDMEAKAKNGLIREANVLFTDIYELMKRKKFSTSQKTSQCNIYTKIVAFHNEKFCYDDAILFNSKVMELVDVNTPTVLKIEVCRTSGVAFYRKNDFEKAWMLFDSALAMAKEHYGESSTVYAEALVACGRSLEAALKIVEGNEGKKSVQYGKILSRMAYNNYAIQRNARSAKYEEATAQAEEALKILKKQLGNDNILLVGPKDALAAIKEDNADNESSERKKTKLLEENENLRTEIVQVSKAVLGEFNPCTAKMMTNLGSTYLQMWKNSEAEQLLTRTLEVQTAMLGPDDNWVAISHNFLAGFYMDNMSQYKKAEEHYMNSIRISEKLFGPAHSQLQFDYYGLIQLFRKTGNDAKMREYEEKKKEWEKLQKETKGKEETDEKDKEGTSTMDFMQMINFVKSN